MALGGNLASWSAKYSFDCFRHTSRVCTVPNTCGSWYRGVTKTTGGNSKVNLLIAHLSKCGKVSATTLELENWNWVHSQDQLSAERYGDLSVWYVSYFILLKGSRVNLVRLLKWLVNTQKLFPVPKSKKSPNLRTSLSSYLGAMSIRLCESWDLNPKISCRGEILYSV